VRSDGKIDQFIRSPRRERTLLLHTYNGQPYYLSAFLLGAYQEILGDLHNLFGDTTPCTLISAKRAKSVDTIVKGESVSEVLDYVQFHDRDLVHRLQTNLELAVREGRIDHLEAGRFVKFYEDGLNGYTYLEESNDWS